jgi:predicted hydrocarbon binding protein
VRKCFCPVSQYHPRRPHDMHCECSRATHQAIFETALGRPVKVEILESVRRGDKTCHFRAHLSEQA